MSTEHEIRYKYAPDRQEIARKGIKMEAQENEKSKSPDRLRIISQNHKIELLFENIKRIDLIIDQFNKGDTKIFKALLAFIALVPIVVGILSYLNFQANTSIIDKNIEISREKIDILVKRQTDELNDLKNSTKSELDRLSGISYPRSARITTKFGYDTVIAIPQIEQRYQNGKRYYQLIFTFNFDVSVLGNGIGRFYGWNVEFSGNLFENIISKISSIPDLGGEINAYKYKDVLERKRSYYTNDVKIIVPGYARNEYFELYQSAEDCKSLYNKLNEIYKNNDQGVISVTPIFEKLLEYPEPKTFHIILASNYSRFTCE